MGPTTTETLLDDALRDLVAVLPSTRIEATLDGVVRDHTAPSGGDPVTADIVVQGRTRGMLKLWAEPGGVAEALAKQTARLLAARLRLATLEAVMNSDVLLLGEANGSIIHAVNNHINGIVLQSMLLQSKLDGPLKERAAGMRAQGVRASEAMRPPQLVELWPATPGEKVDLIATLRGVAAEGGLTVSSDGEGTVALSALAAERAVRLLARLGRAFAAKGAAVETCAGATWLETTLPVPPEGTAEQPTLPAAQGVEVLVGEALEWLLRRSDGDMVVEACDGGTRVRLAWK